MKLKIKTKNTDLEMGVTNKEGNDSIMTEMLSKGLKIIGAMTVAQFTIALIEKKHVKK